MSRYDLSGKVAIITGSGSGIGRRTALTFAEEGADVVINDIRIKKAEKVAEEVESLGAKALAIKTDVTNGEEVDQMVKEVIDKFGKVDLLVNCAFSSDVKFFNASKKEEWDRVINVCLYGVLNCSRAVINQMIDQKYGRIVSIISDAGRVGEPRTSIYSAAKAGIAGFSKALAQEVGRYGVTVNCVSPGATNTPSVPLSKLPPDVVEKMKKRYPLRREGKILGEPEDVANAILFLASDNASWITGQTLSVNGGYSML